MRAREGGHRRHEGRTPSATTSDEESAVCRMLTLLIIPHGSWGPYLLPPAARQAHDRASTQTHKSAHPPSSSSQSNLCVDGTTNLDVGDNATLKGAAGGACRSRLRASCRSCQRWRCRAGAKRHPPENNNTPSPELGVHINPTLWLQATSASGHVAIRTHELVVDIERCATNVAHHRKSVPDLRLRTNARPSNPELLRVGARVTGMSSLSLCAGRQ